jgi:hypothetical protein
LPKELSSRDEAIMSEDTRSSQHDAVAPAVSRDRRGSRRFPVRLEGCCRIEGAKDPRVWPVRVQDISVSGVALLLDRPVEPGTVLTVELCHSDERPPHRVTVRVLHLQPRSRTEWRIGCQFMPDLSDRELQALLPPGLWEAGAS